jgi:hypothetical protein
MKKLTKLAVILVIYLKSFFAFAQPTDVGCLEADVIIVADWSGSTKSNHKFMVEAMYAYSQSFRLRDDGIKIGLISFGDCTYAECDLTSDTNQINQGIMNLLSDSGWHSTIADPVPDLVSYMMKISETARKRTPQKRFVIFISDGEIDNKNGSIENVVNGFKSLKGDLNVITVPIYVGYSPFEINPDWQFMKEIAYSRDFLFKSSYQELKMFLKGLNLCM